MKKLILKYGIDEGIPSLFLYVTPKTGIFIIYERNRGFEFGYDLGDSYSRGVSSKLNLKELKKSIAEVKKYDGYETLDFDEEDLLKLLENSDVDPEYLEGLELFVKNKPLVNVIKRYGIDSKQYQAIKKLYKD